MASFLDALDPEDRVHVEKYRIKIRKIDTKVKEKVSKIMSIENALVYEQDGVFKYGLAKTKHHYTFHSILIILDTFSLTLVSIFRISALYFSTLTWSSGSNESKNEATFISFQK